MHGPGQHHDCGLVAALLPRQPALAQEKPAQLPLACRWQGGHMLEQGPIFQLMHSSRDMNADQFRV